MGREFELRKQVELAATPEEVWQAISTTEGLTAWFMPMDIDQGADGVEADPPRRLLVRTPAAEDGSTQAFEYLIEARGGGSCVLRFVHSGIIGDDWDDETYEEMMGSGWDMYLDTLAQYLRYFHGRPASYVEAMASATGRWDRLLRVLGEPKLGATVGIELPDGSLVSGEVDYRSEHFVGLRTADALIRFHDRSPIGMPVAVSEHRYGTPEPPERTQTWLSWLATTLDVPESRPV
ncbi:SRPBCC domain-containing protein [Actinocatenispora sera]|uniref:SRPBCC family protein n=1 Tax=Actinocatenispora sera TaxID=390989 RepID=UPI0033E792DD